MQGIRIRSKKKQIGTNRGWGEEARRDLGPEEHKTILDHMF